MPIYEYRCQHCETKFSARRAMKDADTPIACPECGSDETKRGLSTFFAISSGSGPLKGAGSSSGAACGSCSASSCATCGGH